MPLALIFNNNNNNVDFIRLVGNESSAFKPLREAVGSHRSSTRGAACRDGALLRGTKSTNTNFGPDCTVYAYHLLKGSLTESCLLHQVDGVFDVGFYTLSNMFVWLLPGPGRAA